MDAMKITHRQLPAKALATLNKSDRRKCAKDEERESYQLPTLD